jgi:hypothetical protein
VAFDLTAQLKLNDISFSKNVQKASKQLDNLKSVSEKVSNGLSRMAINGSRGFDSMSSSSNGLISNLTGLVATIGGVTLAAKGLQAVFGGAMQQETDKLTLNALVQDTEKATKLFDMLNEKGLKSVFSEGDFMTAGKAFLPVTKDLGEINSLLGVTERLASSNPLQGMEGSSMAIREALSGDLVSLQERFNVPRSMLKEAFKGADTAKEKIAALDSVLNKMGFTTQFVNDVNKSASSQWSMLGSNVKTALAKMGGKALEDLKPILSKINEALSGDNLSGLVTSGSQMISNAVKDLINLGTKAVEIGQVIKENWKPISDTILAVAAAAATLRAGFVALGIVNALTASFAAFKAANAGATIAQWALNASMLAFPGTWIVAGIAALVASGVLLYRNFDTVAAKMDGAWQWIKNSAATAMNFVIGKINEMIGLINRIPGVSVPIIPKIDTTPLGP